MAKGYDLPSRQLVSQQDSATIQSANVPRSKFTNAWTRKTAFGAGGLIPILVEEILPGDHMTYDITAYIRMATPLFPIFDNQRIDTHFFFVPCRLLWDNWTRFMGEQKQPGDSIAYTIPKVTLTAGGEPVGSLTDHFGVPVVGQLDPAGAAMTINALPYRAYNLITAEWFRDENVGPIIYQNRGNGPDGITDYPFQTRAKSHDYFTSALPWPQKFTAPTVPLAGLAPVIGIGFYAGGAATAGPATFTEVDRTAVYAQYINSSSTKPFGINASAGPTNAPIVYADLAASTGVAINVLRQAFLVQQLLERDARGGTRYVELILSHFGVRNPDFRLQRPEYIGGGSSPLNITPIAQTAPSAGVPLGAIGGAGTSAGQHRASYAATEHGYIVGLLSVKTELSYQQGLHKLWDRNTRYDFYLPTLAGLGEQAITWRETWCRGNAGDGQVFGYQERWQELRTRYSDVTGLMRSTATGTLDAWHLAQNFTAGPVLNWVFLSDIPPLTRVLAAGAAALPQAYLADIMYHRTAVRAMPTYGTPVTLGRF